MAPQVENPCHPRFRHNSSGLRVVETAERTFLNILIVDDNAAIRRLVAEIVLPFADEIRECSDGAEAVSAYLARRADLVLMDIRMKHVDGIEAVKRIRAVDPSARIIMVTDYDDEALRQAAMHEGAFGYALKDNLLDLIRVLETITPNQ